MKLVLKAPLFFTLAAVAAAGAFYVVSKQVKSASQENKTLATWQAPGSESFRTSEPVQVSIWHDYRTNYDGEIINVDPFLPSGTRISILLDGSTSELPLTPSKAQITTQLNSVHKQKVGSFQLPTGGEYQVTATLPAGETRILSITDGSVGAVIKTLGIGLGLGFVMALFAFLFLILAVLALFEKRKPQSPTPPPLGA